MYRYIKSSSNDRIPEILSDRPVVFALEASNATYSDNILEIVESFSGIRVRFYQKNDKGQFYNNARTLYAVDSIETAQEIFEKVQESRIVTLNKKIYPKEMDWSNAWKISVDDYNSGWQSINWHKA